MSRITLLQSLIGHFILFAFAMATFSLVHGDTESRKDNSVFDIDESGDVQPLTDGLMILDDEQAGDTLTDILRRIDNVIGDTQLMLGDDLPVEPWRWYQLLGILALI